MVENVMLQKLKLERFNKGTRWKNRRQFKKARNIGKLHNIYYLELTEKIKRLREKKTHTLTVIEKLHYNIEKKTNVVVDFLAKIPSHVFMCTVLMHTISCQLTRDVKVSMQNTYTKQHTYS
jgi:hypothetical protein